MTAKPQVYVMQSTCGRTKVGISVDPERRRRELEGMRTPSLRIIRTWSACANAAKVEDLAHRRLTPWHATGELYFASPETCVLAVEDAFAALASGVRPSWAGNKLLTRNVRRRHGWSTVALLLPPAMMQEVEAIQSARLDAPDKGQVVRELLAEALEGRQKGKRK